MGKPALTNKGLWPRLRVLLGILLVGAFLVGCSWRDPNVRKQKYYQNAASYINKGKYREAVILLQNAIKLDPAYADAHYELAKCYLKLGIWKGAFTELKRTVEVAPSNWKAQLDLGNMLLAGKEYGEAESKAKLVLAADPQNVDAHTLLAKVTAALGDSQGSLDEMQQAIRIAPDRSNSYLNLARLQVEAKQFPAAEGSYKKAMALDPRSAM